MEDTKSHHHHAALLASPGMGHLIPILQLANRLVSHHGFHAITIFVVVPTTDDDHNNKDVSNIKTQAQQLLETSSTTNNNNNNNNMINIVTIPINVFNIMVDPTSSILMQLRVIMRASLRTLQSLISDMNVRPRVLIVDLFGSEALSVVAKEFGMLRYVFITTNAWFLALTLYVPMLEKVVNEGNRIELHVPIQIPGCNPIRIEDTLDLLQGQNIEHLDEFVRMAIEMSTEADGIMVNSWHDLERTTLGALKEEKILTRNGNVPVYPIGPLVRPAQSTGLKSGVLKWLDKQPIESVLYVSFGSGGTMSAKQTLELAWGLELSQQRFIWVLRAPVDASGGDGGDGPLDCLPDGFLTRTQSLGLVVQTWAPQVEILGHPSTGGFLSHCGWNSTLESIINGIPMIAWPLCVEQGMNAAILSEDLRVAIRPTVLPSTGLVGREEIVKMVRKIMTNEEGVETRDRVKVLKCSAHKALDKDGSSYIALSKVAKNCKNETLKSVANDDP